MKSQIALAGLALALLPMTALAAPAKIKPMPKTAKTAVMYECAKCHMKVTAAVAKKDGYKDPMDGGTLVPVKTAKH
jgi:hypothetical protein